MHSRKDSWKVSDFMQGLGWVQGDCPAGMVRECYRHWNDTRGKYELRCGCTSGTPSSTAVSSTSFRA
jgi:hypothetical protein